MWNKFFKFVIIAACLCNLSYATGQFSVRYSFLSANNTNPDNYSNFEFGLYIREDISPNWYYWSYSGMEPNNWLISDHFAMYELLWNFHIGAGIGYHHEFAPPTGSDQLRLKVIGVINLW